MKICKKYSILIVLYFISVSGVYAENQICRIIYGKKKIQQSIKESNPDYLFPKPTEKCYNIGVEYDKFNNPLEANPIFTCCKKQSPVSL